MRSRISDARVIQMPVSHVLAKPREEKERGLGHTWRGNGAHLVFEALYPLMHYNVQGDVDCKCDEGEKSRDEREERGKQGHRDM
jgi:hypothetical protein